MSTVHVENIKKTYEKGKVLALDNVSFDVKSGELFGLIGPDGAGKTSLFRVLTTLLLPDGGRAEVAGLDVVKDVWQIRKIVGYMPGKFSLYQDLSIEENLDFFATVFNTTVKQNYHLIEDIYVQIEPFKERLAGKLSGGMKQKLALCCALIHEPKILFLDEPTTGVDPVSRKEFWDMLDRLKARGITIVVSTPYMDEASRCDRIALIQKGKILELDTLDRIIERHTQNLYAVDADNHYQLMKDLRTTPEIKSSFAFGEEQHVALAQPDNGEAFLRQYLTDHNHTGIKVRKIPPTIEDVFIKLMLENQ
jgi:ABC-2 type transport system ATP-binding protein